ncbi:MAG: F0F1 ATP synthase subunit gamma [Planctomycetota bacterium]|jgi:F-type H+-transporting ATPase subunit gamma
MTVTLESLSRQIRSAEDLSSVVRTMKTLAAVSIRQYEEAVESLRAYRRNVEDGLRMLLWDADVTSVDPFAGLRSNRELAVVFGSDQGLCGQFNQQIVTFVTERFAGDTDAGEQAPAMIAVGHRCGSLLDEAGFTVEACLPEANSVTAVTDCVQDLLSVIDRVRLTHRTGHVALYFSQRTTATLTEPHRTRVLPVELRRFADHWDSHRQSRSLPLHTLPRRQLLSSLIREYLFVSLFRACAESLSSENAARIQSMQTAERNITERLRELQSEFNLSRQTSITEELLDIVGGFEVLLRDDE